MKNFKEIRLAEEAEERHDYNVNVRHVHPDGKLEVFPYRVSKAKNHNHAEWIAMGKHREKKIPSQVVSASGAERIAEGTEQRVASAEALKRSEYASRMTDRARKLNTKEAHRHAMSTHRLAHDAHSTEYNKIAASASRNFPENKKSMEYHADQKAFHLSGAEHHNEQMKMLREDENLVDDKLNLKISQHEKLAQKANRNGDKARADYHMALVSKYKQKFLEKNESCDQDSVKDMLLDIADMANNLANFEDIDTLDCDTISDIRDQLDEIY